MTCNCRRWVLSTPWILLSLDLLQRVFLNFSGSFDIGSDRHLAPVDVQDAPLIGNPPSRFAPLLEEFTQNSGTTIYCSRNLTRRDDDIIPFNVTHPIGRKIPKIVHQTGRTRCLATPYMDITDHWRYLSDYSYYFHDDEAVDELLSRHWDAFPQLQQVLDCVVCGTIKADVWRYLVMWEYGGVYADLDSKPGKWFQYGQAIPDDADALFVIEYYGLLSQYFMAIAPRHPIMFHAVHTALKNLLQAPNIDTVDAPFATGPHLLHEAFVRLLTDNGYKPIQAYSVTSGHWVVTNNRTITAIGEKQRANRYVIRNAIMGGNKTETYQQMGMTYFQDRYNANKALDLRLNTSCLTRLYHKHRKD